MAGEVYLVNARWGKETVEGTPVAPTRRLYVDAFTMNPNRESRPVRISTGGPDNVRDHVQGPFQVGGSFTTRIAANELDEFFELLLKTGVSATTPMGATNARERIYVPGTTATATIEAFDGALNWQTAGVRLNSFSMEGSVEGETSISGELFGTAFTSIGSLSGGVLAERNPKYLEGWQATFSIADFGTSVYTAHSDLAMTYSLTMGRNLGRVYTLNNSLNANRISSGLLDVGATIGVDAVGAFADDIVARWRNDQKNVLKIEFVGPSTGTAGVDIIETGQPYMVRFEIPGAWTSPDMSAEQQGVRSYNFPFTYVYDANLAAGIKVTVRSGKTTLWTAAP
jgi:hypothetical protein